MKNRTKCSEKAGFTVIYRGPAFLGSQAGILGNSITEMKAFLSNI